LALGGATLGTHNLAVTGTTQLNSALNYGGVTLSNSVTGTGSMVLSASPTLTGTLTAAAATFSGGATITGANAVTGLYINIANPAGTGGAGLLANFRNAQTGGTNNGAFIGFENAGLYSWVCGMPAAGTALVWVNGSAAEKMRLDLNGNLMLGGTTAYGKLNINSSGAAIVAYQTSSTGYSGFRVYNDILSSARALEIDYSGSAYSGALLSGGPSGEQAAIATTGAYPLVFGTGNTFRGMFDTSGILGIGITPSAWNTFNAAQVGLLSIASYTNGDTDISSNLYYNSGWKYIGTGRSAQIKLDSSTGGGDIKFLVDATGGTAAGATAGTEAARFDSSGNLLVGTTTSSDRLVVNGNNGIRISGISTGNRALYIPSGDILFDNASARSEVRNDGNSASELRLSGRGFVTVYTGGSGLGTGSEAARINSNSFLVGKTASAIATAGFQANFGTGQTDVTVSGSECMNITRLSTFGQVIRFFQTDASTICGSIATSSGATAYNTSSDYRLKENVQPMIGGLDTIAALKPVTYDWIADQTAGEGFIAHELQAVIPRAVTGEKDALDKDGKMDPQGVDFSKIVPHLVAAIQELTTRLSALEAK
jgi:hypothetical protein